MKLANQKFKIVSTRLKFFFNTLAIYLFIFFSSLVLFSCASFNNLIGKNDLILNDFQIIKFHEYLNGKFYSDELKQTTSHNDPMIFAISKNGKSSLHISCYYSGQICNLGIKGYENLKKYSKKLGNELFIFAIGRRIVWSETNLVVPRNIYKSNDFNKLKELIVNKKIARVDNNLSISDLNSYNLLMLPQDNCNSDDC